MLLSMAAVGLGPWALGLGKNAVTNISRTAVLLSAGLDSAVLAASEARTSRVQPIYVSTGLAWEAPRIEHALRSSECAVLRLVLQEADSNAATLARVAHFSRTLEVQ